MAACTHTLRTINVLLNVLTFLIVKIDQIWERTFTVSRNKQIGYSLLEIYSSYAFVYKAKLE